MNIRGADGAGGTGRQQNPSGRIVSIQGLLSPGRMKGNQHVHLSPVHTELPGSFRARLGTCLQETPFSADETIQNPLPSC